MKTIKEFIEQNWMHFRDCWVVMNENKDIEKGRYK